MIVSIVTGLSAFLGFILANLALGLGLTAFDINLPNIINLLLGTGS